MLLTPKSLLTVALLFAASAAAAQEKYLSSGPEFMVRLSYDTSALVEANLRHVCLAVSRDGDYRMVRLVEGQTQRLHGKMSRKEFRQLSKLLRAPDFHSLSGNHRNLLRRESESFAAELSSGESDTATNEPWRLQWMNGDDENPFPPSVSKVVEWLRRFQPKGGEEFEYTGHLDVCPAGGFVLLQPSVAQNLHP